MEHKVIPRSYGESVEPENITQDNIIHPAKSRKIIATEANNQSQNISLIQNQARIEEDLAQKIEEEIEIDPYLMKESKVSQMLSDSTIKKVIIVVLLIQFFIPLFDPTVYTEASHSMDFFVLNLKSLLNDPKTNTQDIIDLTNEVVA